VYAALTLFDHSSWALLADLAISAHFVGFLDDSHFATFTTNANDEPQVEIWEMKLKP
jgi:hypothetical protein